MTNLKLALLWISAAAVIACLGLFSVAHADKSTAVTMAAASPAAAPAHAAPTPATPNQSKADAAESCQAQARPLSLLPTTQATPTTQAACRKGFAWTCCWCGGCGCRDQHISPANWCAC